MRLLLLILVALSWQMAQGASARNQLAGKFEDFAAKVEVFNVDGVLYNQPSIFITSSMSKAELALSKEFVDLNAGVTFSQYQGLLKHPDPKVRTLALAGLYRQGDPMALPLFFAAQSDAANTFPKNPPPAQVTVRDAERLKPMPQTIGDIATEMLRFYMGKAVGPARGPNDFGIYWQSRGERAWCTSWFAVRLQWASRGSYSPSLESGRDIEAIRRQIEQLPATEAALVLLCLRSDYRNDGPAPDERNMLVTDQELVDHLRRLGKDKILQILRLESLSTDPDLQPVGRNYRYGNAIGFPLQHAAELFSAEDAESLLVEGRKCFEKDGDYGELVRTPLWWVAVSKLQPDHAEEILHEGYDLLTKANYGSAVIPLLVLLWETNEKSEQKFISDWFFESTGERKMWDRGRDFLYAAKQSAKVRSLVAMLLMDPRLAQSDSRLQGAFAETINEWASTPIVTGDEVSDLVGRGGKGWSEAPKDIPGVVQRMRASIPEWNK